MDNFQEDALIMYSLVLIASIGIWTLRRRNRNRRQRRYAVRPMNRQRRQFGHYENLVQFMRNSDREQFFKYTRMTPELYDHLLQLISPHLQKDITKNPLSPGHRLTMTLHYLAEGCSMQQIAYDYYVGKATVHVVIKETCQALWDTLSPLYLFPPTTAEWERIAEGFYRRWNMPNCIGALDGKHVIIQSPQHTGTEYFSYKKSFSMVLMAVCDSFYKFTLVDIGAAGSSHDSVVFRNSVFGKALLENQLGLPANKIIPGIPMPFPYFVVADQAFPLHQHIMRPYPGENLSERQTIFNYRLSRARRTIENTFGILVQRWRCLRKPVIGNIETCQQIIQATIVLHNYVQKSEMDIPLRDRKYCPTGFVDYVDEKGNCRDGQWRKDPSALKSVGRQGSNNPGHAVQNLRDLLANYCTSDYGRVPWQNDYILHGSVPPSFAKHFSK